MRPSAPLATVLLVAVSVAARAASLFLDILPPGQDGLVPAITVTVGATVDLRGQTVPPQRAHPALRLGLAGHVPGGKDDIHFAVGGALVVGPIPWQNRPYVPASGADPTMRRSEGA